MLSLWASVSGFSATATSSKLVAGPFVSRPPVLMSDSKFAPPNAEAITPLNDGILVDLQVKCTP
jgi:hypothetical protein